MEREPLYSLESNVHPERGRFRVLRNIGIFTLDWVVASIVTTFFIGGALSFITFPVSLGTKDMEYFVTGLKVGAVFGAGFGWIAVREKNRQTDKLV